MTNGVNVFQRNSGILINGMMEQRGRISRFMTTLNKFFVECQSQVTSPGTKSFRFGLLYFLSCFFFPNGLLNFSLKYEQKKTKQ